MQKSGEERGGEREECRENPRYQPNEAQKCMITGGK
jgi:hypothetical protein